MGRGETFFLCVLEELFRKLLLLRRLLMRLRLMCFSFAAAAALRVWEQFST